MEAKQCTNKHKTYIHSSFNILDLRLMSSNYLHDGPKKKFFTIPEYESVYKILKITHRNL